MKDSTDVLAAVSSGLSEEHFQHPTGRALFRALIEAARGKDGVGLSSLLPLLTTTDGELRIALPRLMEIDNLEPTSIARDKWVSIVIQSHRRRKVHKHLTEGVEKLLADSASWSDSWEAVNESIGAAQAAAVSRPTRKFTDIVDSYIDGLQHPEKRRSVGTGLEKWDREAGRPNAGELIVIGARPGAGKTAMALQVAEHTAGRGGTACIVSLEMRGEELVGRLVLSRGGRAVRGDWAQARQAAVAVATEIRAQLDRHLFVYDSSEGCGFEQLEARARLLAASPGGLSMLVIDYLQLIEVPASAKREQRERQVAEMSRRLKLLAGEIDCPIFILAQLNRESAKEERLPRKEDLRESGAIEQDADRVWLLAMDPDWLKDQPGELPPEVQVLLIQDKCRGGRPGIKHAIKFDRPYYRFSELS